jgi:hypothetical protein
MFFSILGNLSSRTGVLGLKRGISASSSSKKLYRKMGQDNSSEGKGGKPVDARVARRRQDAIGRRLRQMYDDVLGEDVPDDFLSILGEADANKRPKPPGDGPPVPEPVTGAGGSVGADRSAHMGRTVKSDH